MLDKINICLYYKDANIPFDTKHNALFSRHGLVFVLTFLANTSKADTHINLELDLSPLILQFDGNGFQPVEAYGKNQYGHVIHILEDTISLALLKGRDSSYT